MKKLFILLVLCCFTVFQGCEKEEIGFQDSLTEQKIDLNRSADNLDLIAYVIEDMKNQDRKGYNKIKSRLLPEHGVIFGIEENISLVLIPFSKSKNETQGVLFAFVEEDLNVKYHIVKRNQIKQLEKSSTKIGNLKTSLDQELLVPVFINFDREIYEYADCDLIDMLDIYSSLNRSCTWVYVKVSEGGYYTCLSCCSGGPCVVGWPSTYEYKYICDDVLRFNDFYDIDWGSSGGGSYGNSLDPNTSDNIIVDKLMQKPEFECLYTKFLNGSYSLFNNTVGNFKDLTSHHVTIESCLNDDKSGCQEYTSNEWTTKQDGKHITIWINPGQHPLLMADAILHEGIHAAAMLFLEDKNIPNGLNIVEYLRYYKHYNGFKHYADHVFIGDYYIKPVAKALRKLDNYKHPEYKYYGIVYEGIELAIEQAKVYRLEDQYKKYKKYNAEVIQKSSLCD